MATRTLAQLREEAYQVSDWENATLYLDNAEVNRYINEGIHGLWDLMLTTHGHQRYQASTDIVLTGLTNAYNLPADFYIGIGVYAVDGSSYYPLQSHSFRDLHELDASPRYYSTGIAEVTYRFGGTITAATGAYQPQIFITPSESTGTIRVYYIPHAPVITDDADVWDGFNGWEEWVVVDAAIKMKTKADLDATQLMARKAELTQRISAIGHMLDAALPERVVDVSGATVE